MNQEELQKALDRNFNNKDATISIISGEWGSGKSYFWKDYVEGRLSKGISHKDFVYVSLFGITSIQELEQTIVSQLFKHNNFITSTNNFFSKFKGKVDVLDYGTTTIAASAFTSILNVFKKSDFMNVVICFDDLERHSKKLSLHDIIGYINNLRENKNCHIVLVLNEDAFNTTSKSKFLKLKEKLISYEYKFSPSIEEILGLVFKDKNNEHLFEAFKTFCVEFQIRNLRVLKHILNDIDSIFEDFDNKKVYMQAIGFLYVYYMFGVINWNYYLYGTKELKSESEKMILSVVKFADFNGGELSAILEGYVKNRVLNKEILTNFIEKLKRIDGHAEMQERFNKIKFESLANFSYTKDKEHEDLMDLLKDKKSMYATTLTQCIDVLVVRHGDERSKLVADYKHRFTDIFTLWRDASLSQTVDELFNWEPSLKSIYREATQIDQKTLTISDIKQIFENILYRGSSRNLDSFLVDEIRTDELKKYMKEDGDFVHKSAKAYRDFGQRHMKEFPIFEKLQQAFNGLAEESDLYRDKLVRLQVINQK
jgi:hypothetical protein